MKKYNVLAGVPMAAAIAVASPVWAQSTVASQAQTRDGIGLEEVTVTARKHEENLQRVPDAVTAFTAATIQQAGIDHIADFTALTPNLTFQDGRAFRSGFFNLSMRGIGNGQEGWPSVAYLVDGVPADSTDSINSGSLQDVERIEVLRGPQSALYGSGAIAGAINVITRRPSAQPEYRVGASYGNGSNLGLGASAAGPLGSDRVLFRLGVDYRDDDGLIQSSSNGIDLAFRKQKQVQGRLIVALTDDLELDLHGSYDKERNGSTYQDKLPSADFIDDFASTFEARRGFPGVDNRELYSASARVQWNLQGVSLVSVTGYSHIDQHASVGVCYDDPDEPLYPLPGGAVDCLLGVSLGSAAQPGETIDNLFDSLDNFRTVTEDIRLASSGDSAWRWVIGASYLDRKAFQGFDASLITAPARALVTLFPAWNDKEDEWWGIYGQVSVEMADRWELSLAGRYDDQRYDNTTVTDRDQTTEVAVVDRHGNLVTTQVEHGNAFQPKGQISYRVTPDAMLYATVSRGFRAGFYNTGSFTLPEKTTNYELGLKSQLWNDRLSANLAVFRIDYSDQQFSRIVNTPPFRVSLTIPETRIEGMELESTLAASRHLTLGFGLGYLDAQVSDGTRSPAAPHFTGNVTADFSYPLASTGYDFHVHVDDRYSSSLYLAIGNTEPVPAKNYTNLRVGVQNERYAVTAYVKNLADTRQAQINGAFFAGGYERFQNDPRSYGVELRATF